MRKKKRITSDVGFGKVIRTKKEKTTMAYNITDKCICCGTCEVNCPVQAITKGKEKYEIDPKTCISCGLCASVCPVLAPEPNGEAK